MLIAQRMGNSNTHEAKYRTSKHPSIRVGTPVRFMSKPATSPQVNRDMPKITATRVVFVSKSPPTLKFQAIRQIPSLL
jgi:hypothetical protein